MKRLIKKDSINKLSKTERFLFYAIIVALGLSLSLSALSLLLRLFPELATLNIVKATSSRPNAVELDLIISFVLVGIAYAILNGYLKAALSTAWVLGIIAIWYSTSYNGYGFFDPVNVFVFVILIVVAAYQGRISLFIACGMAMASIIIAFFWGQYFTTTDLSLRPTYTDLAFYLIALGMATTFLNTTLINTIKQSEELNRKTQELEQSQSALEAYQGHLEDLVNSRTAELTEAMGRAEEANKAKSVFLATMSHELRTPLNAIIGYSEIIAEESEELEMEDHFLADANRIRTAGKHLLEIINAVLDLSKIESDQYELNTTEIILDDLLEDFAGIAQPLIEKNNNDLIVEIRERPNQFYCDAARLRQILLNLVGNAAKFTSNGLIRIIVNVEDAFLLLRVSDTGIGIKPEFLPNVFDQFAQEQSSHTRKFGGTGLGLAITKELITLLGGEIQVESEHNVGTTFICKLPLEPVKQKPELIPSLLKDA